MTTMLRGSRALAAAIPLLLVAAACAGTSDAGDSPSAGAGGSISDDAAAIRVDYVGGFMTPDQLVTRLPLVAIYGDGRVITQGPQPDIYPSAALPNVQVRKINPADVEALVKRAVDAGVGADRDFGEPPVADAPSTRFTVLTDGGTKQMEIPALGESDGTGLTSEQQANRKAAKDLLAALTDLTATLGEGKVGAEEQYVPTAIAAIATPWTKPEVADGPQPPKEVAWPGPQLPGETLGGGLQLGCVTADGEMATKVLAAARGAVSITPWTSAGKRWRLALRPLLPDETGCADLRATS